MEQQTPIREPESPLPPLPVGVLCPDCGYDLRGSTSERCSECGFVLEELRRQESLIPWSHRRQLGLFRAYWKTVWLVIRSSKRLRLEMARPVSFADSQSFRWITTLHAYLAILLGSAIWVLFALSRGWAVGEITWWVLGGLQVWALLVLATLPGLASYFFHPRRMPTEQQNRAVGLSYYGWAPWAFVPAVIPLWLAGLLTWDSARSGYFSEVCLMVGGAIPVFVIVLIERRFYDGLRWLLHRSATAAAMRTVVFNVLAAVLTVLLLTPPLAAFYLALIAASFR